jgi:sulfur-oxidizing protein SoxB
MIDRREFLQFSAIIASIFSGAAFPTIAQPKNIKFEELLKFNSKGQITLLHITDIHGQLKPVFFRPPSENYGVGNFEDIPPHLVGQDFLDYFSIQKGSPLAYAHTMVDYIDLAKEYGMLGGLDRTASIVKAIRQERGNDKVLLLDGGDTWQGSYTSLKTQGMDMLEAMKLLKPEAMVGHWEFTLGKNRLEELIKRMNYPFLGGNVFDNEWDEQVFDSTLFVEKGGVNIAIIGQHFPYTPIANPRHLVEGWSFGIRAEHLQKNIIEARSKGAEIVVLLSHNGFDVDQKIAAMVEGIDVILTGHTHDAIPKAIRIKNTLLLSSGSHGKYLGRVDLEVKNGKVVDSSSALIPIFSEVISPDKQMSEKIKELRSPFEKECNRVIGKAETLLYRRGNFNGSWDEVICDAIIQERDCEIALSPGFRWGTTLLPSQDITIDDMYSQTAMNYPEVYKTEMTGSMLRELLEDICDNIFNKDPFLQQGGDMVRVGGLAYSCSPKEKIGKRIKDLVLLRSGMPIENEKKYVVSGWGSINENVEGPPIYDLLEKYITGEKSIKPQNSGSIKVIGMK